MDADAVGRLPFPLAYVWRDLEHLAQGAGHSGRDAVVGLYHLLDALEVCAKFLAALCVAEAEAGGVEFSRPDLTWLGERPALGTWLAVLDHVDTELAKGPGSIVVPRLHEAVAALGQVRSAHVIPPEVPAKDLVSLRNWVAHGGVPAAVVSAEIFSAGRGALEGFMEVASGVFAGVALVHVDADGTPSEVNFEAESSFDASSLRGAEPGLYVSTGERWLQIWPLVRHAAPGKGTDPGRQLVTQVFVRLQAGVAEYATLDERSVAGWGRAEAAAFRRRFTDAAQIRTGFWAETRAAADAMVGRGAELARIRAALEEGHRGGPRRWWLSAPWGQGKSTLAASAAVEAKGRGEVVLAHFFRSDDPRCSLRAFVTIALEALDPEGATGDLTKDSARLRTLLAERDPVVVCDGLDELERATSSQEIEDLVALSSAGGTWLFSGRRNLDTLAARVGLSPLIDGGLGPMGVMDLRALVVRHAPQAVRDAILRHDAANEVGELENPYVAALAERAEGLPLYVVLMMEWLASFRSVAEIKGHIVAALEDPGHVLPARLDALYAQLVEGWGLGTLATIKTFLLCLLCAAAEPLDIESIAQICFGGFLPAAGSDEGRQGDVAQCTEVLSLFAPVLRLVNDSDGRPGWGIFHDSFRGYLDNPANDNVARVYSAGRQALARLGADPDQASHEPLRRHLYRHGITYLRDAGDNEQADRLLGDFGYLYRRLGCLQIEGVEGLLSALEHSENPQVAPWSSFVRSRAHFLRREVTGWGPHQSLHQLAYDSAVPEVATAVKDWSGRHHRPTLYRIAGTEPSGAQPIVLEGHSSEVRGALELRDGRILSWSDDKTLRVWDSETGAALGSPLEGHSDEVSGGLELRDGRILSWSCDTTLRLWELNKGRALGPSLEGHSDVVTGALELRDGRILSWSQDATLRLWDPDTGRALGPPFRGHTGGVIGALELRDGRILSWSGYRPFSFENLLRSSARGGLAQRHDHILRMWDPSTGAAPSALLESHSGEVRGALELRDGRILSWSDDKTLRVWDSETGAALGPPLEGHTESVRGALELRDGRILSWSNDGTIRRWDPRTGAALGQMKDNIWERLKGFVGHAGTVEGALELRDGRILSWSDGHTLRLWDPDTGSAFGPPIVGQGHAHEFLGESFGALELRDGRILSWSDGHTLQVWDPDNGPSLGPHLEGHTESVRGALGLRDGRILSWSDDNTLRLWDPNTGSALGPPVEGHAGAGALELRDGRILSWSDGHTLRVWDPDTGSALSRLLKGHTRNMRGALELRDGRILSWSWDTTLRLWDPRTGAALGQPLKGHTEGVLGALELRDGRILSWSKDRTLRMWDPDTGAAVGTPVEGYSGRDVNAAVYGALELRDGRILSWSDDETLRLWDPYTGAAIGTLLKGHTRSVIGALELRDGRILSWSSDETLRLWDPDTCAAIGTPLEGHTGIVIGALELRDGRILSWAMDNTLLVWDPGNGALAETLEVSVNIHSVRATPFGFVCSSRDALMLLTDEQQLALHAWWSFLLLTSPFTTLDNIGAFRQGAPVIVGGDRLTVMSSGL